ncbi:MAG: NAD(P)H-binding protein [Pseudomonadales bacterium]|nr:NAD(P)H-binding protein [Pseudomonadales bacterium]MCP5184082.1 NAD(P)H-binding protein [Pseudomonadales bacterium]
MTAGRVLVTGANGHLGRLLLKALPAGWTARAAVRSQRAVAQLTDIRELDVVCLDYADVPALAAALEGVTAVVHLVGILKESPGNTYQAAHETTCAALVDAIHQAGAAPRIAYLSILGASPTATNRCLASKGRAERLLLDSGLPVTVLQVPMVLGENDYASRALQARARAGVSFGWRLESLEQPLFAGDAVQAVLRACEAAYGGLRLAGPESLSRRDLILRVARLLGTQPRLVSLPMSLGMGVARVLESLSGNPVVTAAMLEVLDHDDAIDPAPAAARLGIELTPLDDMLRYIIGASRP